MSLKTKRTHSIRFEHISTQHQEHGECANCLFEKGETERSMLLRKETK